VSIQIHVRGKEGRLRVSLEISELELDLDNEYEEIIAMLNSMEKNAGKFCF